MLEAQFSLNEIKKAMWLCGGDKAPGRDDFFFAFIKRFWDIIGHDFINAVIHFGRVSTLMHGCNDSFITLIPKAKDPLGLRDYRPIHLLGYITKTKIFLLRVDFEKAFDNLNWNFLFNTLAHIGFGKSWIRWNKGIVCKARVSVLVNGSSTAQLPLEKVVQQGNGWEHMRPYENPEVFPSSLGLERIGEKSTFTGVGISHLEQVRLALLTGCKESKLPFNYLGMPICARRGRVAWGLRNVGIFNVACLHLVLDEMYLKKGGHITRWNKIIPRKVFDWFWEKEYFFGGCNSSFLTLIQKASNPLGLHDFLSISLIGILYKIISKVLAERLKKVMDDLISNVQSVFLKGRSILDGILIADKVIDELKRSKKKGVILKVDFEKAYDYVRWPFLIEGLEGMGFGVKWRKWIRAFLSSSTMSVLVNGASTLKFRMEKGEWETENIKNLIKLLECFHAVSGLKINLKKNKLYMVGVKEEEVKRWARTLSCDFGRLLFLYLALPVGASMRKVANWTPGLLGKWWWRFLVESGSLLVKVIKSKFSKDRGLGEVTSRHRGGGSSVWESIVKMGSEIDRLGIEFSNSFWKVIGDEEGSSFWEDSWLEVGKLKDKFRRLFHLETNKEILVAGRGEVVRGLWRWKWDWRREPRGRELG
ncbi:hypothetical protein OSB04_019231 [Centaurea solstitialis]|uniref:Reverse transcriptase domain-containing protein n=1 Tax=Centaurea solstitialis TaxID=347529 RepID=A0AA38SQF6_9ASTR|nr:hypothetical protein OSB04_019231 [Centaurea solstitialis]